MTRYLIAVMTAALVVALTLAALQSVRVERLKVQNAALTVRVKDLETAQTVARADAQTRADRCDVRVDQARQSARAVERIIERPIHVDPQGCPVRELVPADELRDALTPGVGPAEPVH